MVVDEYRLVDDPETGQRFLVYPNGEWAVVDMRTLNDLAESGRIETLSPEARTLVNYLTS